VQKLSVRHVSNPIDQPRQTIADPPAPLKVQSERRFRSRKRYSQLPAGDGGAAIAAVTGARNRIPAHYEGTAEFAAAEARMTGHLRHLR
jgi:hypothetical protein